MDPNIILDQLGCSETLEERFQTFQMLRTWLARGGFEPEWDDCPEGTLWYKILTLGLQLAGGSKEFLANTFLYLAAIGLWCEENHSGQASEEYAVQCLIGFQHRGSCEDDIREVAERIRCLP